MDNKNMCSGCIFYSRENFLYDGGQRVSRLYCRYLYNQTPRLFVCGPRRAKNNSSCAAFRCAMARERDRAPQIRTTEYRLDDLIIGVYRTGPRPIRAARKYGHNGGSTDSTAGWREGLASPAGKPPGEAPIYSISVGP